MKVSIMQPNMFMWSGLLKSLIDSDIHIILDHVFASKNSRYNRNLIAGSQSETWLTIPYLNFSRNKSISELAVNTSYKSNQVLLGKFRNRYVKSPYFDHSYQIIQSTLESTTKESTLLVDLYEHFLGSLRTYGLKLCKTIKSSQLIYSDETAKELKGIDMVNYLLKMLSATTYLAAHNTVNYASRDQYNVSDVLIQDFKSIEYPQALNGQNIEHHFRINMSILDAISFMDLDALVKFMDASNEWKIYDY